MDSLRQRLERAKAKLSLAKDLIKEVSAEYKEIGMQVSGDMVNDIGTLIEEQVSYIKASLHG